MVKNRVINHKLEQLEPRLLLSADGMCDVLAAPSPISSGFDSAIEQDLNCIELTGKNDRLYSLEQTEASSDIFQFNDEDLIPEEQPLPMHEQEDVQQGEIVPETENSESGRNEEGMRVERYQIESGFNSEDVVISYFAYNTKTHTDGLVETLHAANGPPGRKGVTGEFVYHASPGTNEFTLRLNPADNANAHQLKKKMPISFSKHT